MGRRKIRRKIRHSTVDSDDDEPLFGPGSNMGRCKIRQSMEDSDDNDQIFGDKKQDNAQPNLSVLAAFLKPVIDLDEGDHLLGDKMTDEDTPPKNVAAAAEAETRLGKKPHSCEEMREAKRERREKALPKPTLLDKALAQIEAGASDVNLIHLGLEPRIDSKLASLIDYVKTHPHVDSVELQAIYLSF